MTDVLLDKSDKQGTLKLLTTNDVQNRYMYTIKCAKYGVQAEKYDNK